ncbi:MAG: DUF21 domain-containing protein [Planctomycetota bacterium]|nr:DUF21 domain-containing protein [Planctomycetaceae bacterium]MDQ3330131.1 DUF21 domain-containing protein [Planctomycetota bacterium]
MSFFLELLAAIAIFLLGLGMSFFFSGTETAFYRVSTVRLMIAANAGDRISRRLLAFAHRPGRFVATTLVGNNVANYLVSIGTGLATVLVVRSEGLAEVVGTWMVTPLVFVCGELLPKNICYITPSWLLRRGSALFRVFYVLFLPITLPLAMISHLLERIAGAATGTADLVFGRNRLTQVFSQGRQAGLLSDAQSRFLTGLLTASGDAVERTMTPADRIFGLHGDATRDEVLEHARRLALTEVVLGSKSKPGEWTHYVRVAELAVSDRPLATLKRPLPRFEAGQAKLEVLLALRTAGDSVGGITRDGVMIGVANERGLVESVFRAGRPLAVASTAA